MLETLLCAVGRHEEGLAAATRAADLARATGDQGALARAEVGRGTELGALRRIGEALAILEAAIRWLRPLGTCIPFRVLWTMPRLTENAEGNSSRHCSLPSAIWRCSNGARTRGE